MSRMKAIRLTIGAGALLLAALSGAQAQEEEGVAAKSILGALGIIPKDRPQIDYRERAPLVLPPKTDLPQPVDSAAIETRVANWPKDPDVASRRKADSEARKGWHQTELYKNSEGRRLSIEEVRAGRNPNARFEPTSANAERRSDMSRMSPDELRSFDRQEAPVLASGGLERRYISDPPQSLLQAAGGKQLKATQEPKAPGDPDSPHAFIRQQQQRY